MWRGIKDSVFWCPPQPVNLHEQVISHFEILHGRRRKKYTSRVLTIGGRISLREGRPMSPNVCEMPLEKELATYKEKLPELLAEEGKFVLIHGDTVVATYSSYEDAVKDA